MNRNLVWSNYGRSSIYKDCSFHPNPLTNMVSTDNLNGRFWQFVYKENDRCTRLIQSSLQVVIRQMFVLCSLKIEAQWSEPMSFTFHSALRKLIQTEPSIGASHQSSAHLAKQFVSEKKIVRNRPIRNKNFLWRPCLSTDRNEKCNLYRRPSIVASYQVSVHMAKQFERRRFDKIGQLETRIDCGAPQPNKVKLSRKHLWKVLCSDYSFRPEPLTNMVATGDSCFWLAD
jgi:hypothetical protein